MRPLFGFFLLAIVSHCSAQIASSNFDANADGWYVKSIDSNTFGNPPNVLATFAANHSASGRNPGGRIWSPDVSGGPVTWFSAPAKFLGNQSSAYGGSLTFDIKISASNVVNKPGLILVGNGMTLYRLMTIAGSGWNRYSIPLSESGWRLNSDSGAQPTQAQFAAVLSNLSALYINSEWDWANTNEVGDLDNVILALNGSLLITLDITLNAWASNQLPAAYVTIDGINGQQYLINRTGPLQGTITIAMPTTGVHRVRVKPSTFLAQALMIDSSLGVQTVAFHGPSNTGLFGGDVDDDNEINLVDFGILASGFSLIGDDE